MNIIARIGYIYHTSAVRATNHKALNDLFSCVILGILCLWAFLTYQNWHFDDALIVDRIVYNIIHHKEWAYNLGEILNASTSVLNTILIAITASFLPVSILTASHIVTALALFLAGWILYGRTFMSLGPLLSLCASSLLVVLLSLNSTWGLETNLFISLSLLAISLPPGSCLSGAVFGALILTRPDGVLFFGIHSVYCWYRNKKFPALSIIAAGVVLIPWFIFSYKTFHSLFPDTLSNKIWQGRSGYWGPGLVYAKALYDHNLSFGKLIFLVIPFFLMGLIQLFRNRSLFLELILFVAIQQVCYIFLNVPGYHWYFSVLDFVVISTALFAIFSLIPSTLPALWLAPIFIAGFSGYHFFGINTANLKDGRDVAYKEVIPIVKAKSHNANSVALIEVGTIGYELIDKKIVDLLGLTSKNSQFITNEHLDEFFSLSPPVVILHEPVWHFESSIFEDLRFKIAYEKVGTGGTAPFTMSVYIKKNIDIPNVEEYVRQNYAELKLAKLQEVLPNSSSEKALCTIDLVNGTLVSTPEVHASLGPLTFKGWAVVKGAMKTSEDVLVVLHSENGETYAISAQRHDRPDVAIHLGEQNFVRSGFSVSAHTLSSSKGSYGVSLVQIDPLTGTKERCDLSFKLILR